MNDQVSLSDLEAYAKKRIAAHRFPNDFHTFVMYKCDTCGVVPLRLAVEHHTGSKKSSFRGVIHGVCSECASVKRVFSFTGQHRERIREEIPKCKCGHDQFFVGECERIERDDGMMGFFDEGVVVGKCPNCNRKRTFVHTD